LVLLVLGGSFETCRLIGLYATKPTALGGISGCPKIRDERVFSGYWMPFNQPFNGHFLGFLGILKTAALQGVRRCL